MIQSTLRWFECFAPEADCGLLRKGGSQFECGCSHGNEQSYGHFLVFPFFFFVFFLSSPAVFLTEALLVARHSSR